MKMGKSKFDYYGVVKKLIMISANHCVGDSEQIDRIKKSMGEVNEEISKQYYGPEILKAVDMILLRKTKSIEGAALELHHCENTVKLWINSYVYKVAKKAGFNYE